MVSEVENREVALLSGDYVKSVKELNCIVIHELFVTTELPNDELTSIRT